MEKIAYLFSAVNMLLAGFPLSNLSVKTCINTTKTCLTYAFVTWLPFDVPSWNLDTCIFVTSTMNNFNHIIVSVIVLAAQPQ